MWYWKIVFLYKSRNETMTFGGKGYPTREIAEWERSRWLKKFLPYFYLYKILDSEIGECDDQTGDNQ